MITYFASPERADGSDLQHAIEYVSASPLMSALLRAANGMLAVLNEKRQILAVNDSFLRMLNIENPAKALGLRPGEAVKCIHADEMPGGCGTSRFCSTCGAAIAIVASLASEQPVERTCAIAFRKGDKQEDMCLSVRSCLTTVGDMRLVLLYLQDITMAHRWAALGRVFLHDLNNQIASLRMASELLRTEGAAPGGELSKTVSLLAGRLADEVKLQQALLQGDSWDYQPVLQVLPVDRILREACAVATGQPAAGGRALRMTSELPGRNLRTDPYLVLRILNNMLLNAFEATAAGGEVRLWAEGEKDRITFCVWNKSGIPEDVGRRVFQRNFSTKEEPGRGLGTYSMKLLGEKLLGGTVDFTSSKSGGTVFRLRLPA